MKEHKNRIWCSCFKIVLTLLLISKSALSAQTSELTDDEIIDVKSTCARIYPSWIEILDYRACILKKEKSILDEKARIEQERMEAKRNALEQKIQAEEQLRKQQAALPCIEEEIPRIERVIGRAKDSITPFSKLSYVVSAVNRIFGTHGEIVTDSNDLLRHVYVLDIPVKCNTDFAFRINIDFDSNYIVNYFKVYVLNAPNNYKTDDIIEHGLIKSFYRDVKTERKLWNNNNLILSGAVTLSNYNLTCSADGTCYDYTISLMLNNNSQKKITQATFSVILVNKTEILNGHCAASSLNISTNIQILPGSSQQINISQSRYSPINYIPLGFADQTNYTICISLAGIDVE